MQNKEKKTVCEAGIVALTFNKDRSQCAFSPNNHLIYIYSTTAGGNANDALTWKHIHTLEGHQQSVTAIDWHHATNRLLTVGQDRQSFVWILTPYNAQTSTDTPTSVDKSSLAETWVPQIVELDASVKRGLMCCKWVANEKGDKLYVGSAACNVAVGTFNVNTGWWYGKVIECHKSTVTTLAPHPTNSTVLATGSTDGTVAISSTYVKSVEGKGIEAEKFGTELSRVALPGSSWVHSIAWSPSGEQLAVVSHDSRIYILGSSSSESANKGKEFVRQTTVTLAYLPMKEVQWISNTAIIAAGFDFFPILVQCDNGKWSLKGKWTAERPSAKGTTVVQSQASLARLQFQNESRTGQKAAVELVNSRHKNTINGVWPLTHTWDGASAGNALFVTNGMDGLIEFWKADEMTPES